MWPPESHTQILISSKQRQTDESAYVDAVLKRFMSRAFRRPVTDEEVSPYRRFFEIARKGTDTFEKAIRETLAMVLISPDFLYLVEPSKGSLRKATDWELASRLSYFLWSTIPDQRLFQLAQEGELSDPTIMRCEITRMIKDKRSWSFVEQFAGQWLDVGALDRVAVNPEYYPDFDNHLKASMRGETLHFFNEIRQKNMSALNFIDSNFTMLDQPLAEHYGIKGPRGSTFERVSLSPGDQRGGVLAQGSVLLGNSPFTSRMPL